ncbi:MAG: lamin tail domain-containing protein [bacterium]
MIFKRCLLAVVCLLSIVVFFAAKERTVQAQGMVVVINKFLPKQASDWNGDGIVDGNDEWIELYNTKPDPISLLGWKIDDVAGGGSKEYTIAQESSIAGFGTLVFFKKQTGVILNDTGDTVRLTDPAGNVDEYVYSASQVSADVAVGRCPAGSSTWVLLASPVIGSISCAFPATMTETVFPTEIFTETVTATPEMIVTETATETAIADFSETPLLELTVTPLSSLTSTITATHIASMQNSNTPTRTRTITITVTPSATVTITVTMVIPQCADVVLNEVLAAPSAQLGEEWVELYNRESVPVQLLQWQLDDVESGGSKVYSISTPVVVQPHGWLVLSQSDTKINFNNDGDTVRLLCPDGSLVDSFSYVQTKTDFSWGRYPDGSGEWVGEMAGTRDLANVLLATATATFGEQSTATSKAVVLATVTKTATFFISTPTAISTQAIPYGVIELSEFLPAPGSSHDWDGSGKADGDDEWIELYNSSDAMVNLSGWMLDDGENGSKAYVLPATASIGVNGYAVFYKKDTKIALNNDTDTVRLLRPDGTIEESYLYSKAKTDQSFVKVAGAWQLSSSPSPGYSTSGALTASPVSSAELPVTGMVTVSLGSLLLIVGVVFGKLVFRW